MNLVVIDIETTGLNPRHGKIVEIGAVRIAGNYNIMSRFQTIIWPGEEAFDQPGAQDALRVQSRRILDFKGGEKLGDAIRTLLWFVKDDQVISYNSQFEKQFLGEYFDHVRDWEDCIMISSSEIMGKAKSPHCPWNGYHQNYKWPRLVQAAEFFDVPYDAEGGHSALHDAEVAALIWLKILLWQANEDQKEEDKWGLNDGVG